MKGTATVMARAAVAVLAAVLGAALLGGCGGAVHRDQTARGLFGYDQDRPLGAQVVGLRAFAGDDLQAVTYSGAGGDRVPGLLAFPPGQTWGPCVIYMHGFGRSKEDAAPLVAPLADLGIGLLAIDAPYHGARATSPAEFERVRHDPRRVAGVLRQTVVDMRRGLDFLDTRQECDPSRLGVIGFSFGALTAALLAGSDSRVQSTVLLSTGAGWGTLLRRPGFILSRAESLDTATFDRALRTLDPYGAERWVGRIAPRPVLFVNGRHDEVTPITAAERLQRAGGKGSTVLWYDGGHDPFSGPQAADVAQRVEAFLRRTLVQDAQDN